VAQLSENIHKAYAWPLLVLADCTLPAQRNLVVSCDAG